MGRVNMLSSQEFDDWCRRLNLPEVGKKVIEQIRSTEPVRLVQGGGGNVTGNYCIQKMGKTLQFESHKVELPGISEFDLLVQRGEIVGLKVPEQTGIHPEARERFLKASPEALAEANRRYQVIEPYLNGGKREMETVPLRTIRNWKSKFRAAEQN